MKIGDKVRFLSDVGGGRVAGFKPGDIVLVEDEDGFEIPTPMREVVVVNNEDYSSKHLVENKATEKKKTAKTTSIKQQLSATDNLEEEETDPADGFKAKPEERKGGDKLSAYVAFVPKDFRDIANTQFASYFINDSNYYLHYVYMVAEGTSWMLRSVGEVAPNTKIRIEEFSRDQLNTLQHAAVQLTAYKREKTFLQKPTIDVQLRLDPVKFYKLNTFRENDFFETPALLYTIVENDRPSRPLVIDAQQLKEDMYGTEKSDTVPQPARIEPRRSELVRRYDKKQSKSHPVNQRLKDDKIIVDLHASELLDTTAGMSASDILDYQMGVFKSTIEQYKDKKGQKLIFIHGKGEGVLRRALIHELNYRYKQHSYQDASFQEYGYGATQVTIR